MYKTSSDKYSTPSFMWLQFLCIWLCNLTIYGVTPPVEFGIGKQLLVITDIKVESSGQLISITGQNFPLYKDQLQIVLEGKEFLRLLMALSCVQ